MATSQIGTSNIGKYTVGAEVFNLGPENVSGFIIDKIPQTPGATTGPGSLVIGPTPPMPGCRLKIDGKPAARRNASCVHSSKLCSRAVISGHAGHQDL